MEISFDLPIYWVNERKTKASTTHLAGMNYFMNAHYHTKNKMKKDFSAMIYDSIEELQVETLEQYKVHYRLYYKNLNSDGSNVIAVIEKFLLDALQHLSITDDDNVRHHLGSSWEVVEQDRSNPRVEITISSIS